jgi:4-hydroxybenzoate polyprenyltransferase
VPIVAAELPLKMDHWITFVQRFLIVIVLTLPFDIRDIHNDISALQTLPQQLGIKKVKYFGISLLLVTILMTLFKPLVSVHFLVSLFITCSIMGVMLVVSEAKQPKYFASFWVESIPLLWILILLIDSQLF